MVFFVDTVKSIVFKLHFGFAVTVNTPAHAKIRELLHFTHFLNFTVAGLALHLSGFYVLGMVKIYVVGQIVDTNPFDRLGIVGIPRFSFYKTGILI
jgi:hypothetical protein